VQHSTGKPTKAEQARLDAVHAMPCIPCEIEIVWSQLKGEPVMSQPLRTEANHLVDKGTRKLSGGHSAIVPICGWHHRGEPAYPLGKKEMKGLHGPSFALHKREFDATYGTQRELLALTDELLILPAFQIRGRIALFAGQCAGAPVRHLQAVHA
jgi:hypothetical protein